MLFEKVLFATDFSEVSQRALDYVIKLREAGCGEVALLHVIDEGEVRVLVGQPADVWSDEGLYETQILERMHREASEEMDRIQGILEEKGVAVHPFIVKGVPFQEIIRVADAEDDCVIVVGSHGRSNVSQMLLGSVSENVIRHAKQPVLVVRRPEPA